jgi:ditrans,polycis-polyprenyl diphosphate synthase
MSALALNNTNQFHYTWLQRLTCNIIRYGCTSSPRHIAIVMDGNRRYARQQQVERARGHSLGADKLFDVCQWCHDLGINELSVYAFSLENLKRSQDEIDTLMNIARSKLHEIEKSLDQIHEQQICIRIIGNLDLLPDDIKQASYRLMNETDHYQTFVLNVCLYYTSRHEITNVMKDLVKGCEQHLLDVNDIDDDLIMRTLIISSSHTGRMPDIFLRTSGELRLSDFMLMQCRFAMWIFADVYWPAFTIWHLYWIILQYEMKSNALLDIRQQCDNLLRCQTSTDEHEKSTRINNYCHWLEQRRIERLKS